jgi:tetratricopeptide (TPR) repeat protein
MRHLLCMVYFMVYGLFLVAQPYYLDSKEEKQIWGTFDHALLLEAPFGKWYEESIADYTPDLALLTDLHLLEHATVTIYLGTWCGDSKNWVPKFVELWRKMGKSTDDLIFIGLGNGDEYYKRGPNGEEKGKDIHRVPTFVFQNEGKEIGRIVERPIGELAYDLAQIDRGVPATPRYRAVSILYELINAHDDQYIYTDDDRKSIIREVYREVSGPAELNSLGYVLKAAGRLNDAQFVFEMNTRLFSYTPNCFDSLGELYLENEEYQLAKECFERVKALEPNDERAIAVLDEISKKMKE